MVVKEIINNRLIKITPKNIYHLIIFFGIIWGLIWFVIGCIAGYTLTIYILYNQFANLIYNHGTLIFDDRYYKFIEVYPALNELFINNFSMI